MKRPPFFSVVIPTHKRAALLRRALESVRAQQSPVPFEILVVSDASDAETDAVCLELLDSADTYIRRTGNAGPSHSRNVALEHARGDYVLFLDDDDRWHPGLLEHLHAHPFVQQGEPVYFNCSIVEEQRFADRTQTLSEVGIDLKDRVTEEVFVKNQGPIPCFALPRRLLDDIRFDPYMRSYEDWEFLLAVFERRMPRHVPILGAQIYKSINAGDDRRGTSQKANDFNAVLDYLYVYRRRPAPTIELKEKRAALLANVAALSIPADTL
ncbi:glycosyltransferase family 2 protein [Paraburkholderia lycopersici]|uniref:Glycosyl transferase family 2 n=1 Tax=Paraburkholderia lycopersici TaxID=416944 RepID=A0A1G6T5K4_9BURK|nr:glycosyltransferase family A protein [Paraburkholderia lycopersici]SDD24309.1 Glycosyl transferase family 2 [Paraburkholderia lycopersici]